MFENFVIQLINFLIALQPPFRESVYNLLIEENEEKDPLGVTVILVVVVIQIDEQFK